MSKEGWRGAELIFLLSKFVHAYGFELWYTWRTEQRKLLVHTVSFENEEKYNVIKSIF